jgi:hypothetical protein
MTHTPLLLKAAVIGGAIVMGSGFVYVRAGGRLPGIPQEESAKPAQKDVQTGVLTDSQRKAIMYSSKSGAIVPSSTPSTGTAQSTRPAAQPAKTASGSLPTVQPVPRRVIMSGSKSVILTDPKDSPIINGAANTTSNTPATSRSPLEALPPVPPAINQQPSPLEVAPKPAPPQPSPLEALKQKTKRTAAKSSPAPKPNATDPLPAQRTLQQAARKDR